jgi:hypothetical protein
VPDEEMKCYLNIYGELALLVVEQKFLNKEYKSMGVGITCFRGD